MTQAASCEAEALQREVRAYLQAIDRPGDVKRIAQRLARTHSRGSHVVGFRRRGYEVLIYENQPADAESVLGIYEVGVDGQLLRAGTIWKGDDLEQWVDRHHHFLEWIRPDLRPESTTNHQLSAFTDGSDYPIQGR